MALLYDVTSHFRLAIPKWSLEFSAPLRLGLDNPGGDFVILDTSMMVEEKSARPPASALGGLFLFQARSRQP
jgi:hypothetical protein